MTILILLIGSLNWVLGASPFSLIPNYQIVCDDSGGRCEEICRTKCSSLEPAAFAECLKLHGAGRCRYKHTENYAIPAKHVCRDPLSGIHAFVYESSDAVALHDSSRVYQGRASSGANQSRALINPMHHHGGRRLQSGSSTSSILRIWGWFQFEYLNENCTVGTHHQFPTKVVSGIGPYDDYACLHDSNLWNSANTFKTYIAGESPDKVWVDLTNVEVKTVEGEAYNGIQVWVDLWPCYGLDIKAYQAGLEFTALFDLGVIE